MLEVREMRLADLPLLLDYWLNSPADHLVAMGVDLAKLPSRGDLETSISSQLSAPIREKQSYALVWLIDGVASGHCNVNQVVFGDRANMHLHLWEATARKRGLGQELLMKSLPFFFENLHLKALYCEPFAKNEAPNRALGKLGFSFVKTYKTIPGNINFEQPVNQWLLMRKHYLELIRHL